MVRVWAVPVIVDVVGVVVLRRGKVGTGFEDKEGNHDVNDEFFFSRG